VALRGALALDPTRYLVSVIAGSGDRLLDEAATAGLEVMVEPCLRSPLAPRDDVRALRHLAALISGGRFDVVHTHCAKAGTLGRLAAHRAHVPRIVHTYHGFPFHEFQSSLRRATYVEIERRLGRFTDVALCVGTGVAVEAIRRGLVAPERVRTIGVTVDGNAATRTPESRRRARRALGVPENALVVGAVGRLAYQKAPQDFVDALRRIARPDVVGVWVGDGELADEVRQAVRLAAPRTQVILAGERPDVTDLLPAFDVFALPSRYEGLPVAIVEAMVAGVPVVATAVNAVSDVVVPGVTGLLVPPARPDLLATAVTYLLDHQDEAAAMATAARRHVSSTHSPAALGRVLADAYDPAAPTPSKRWKAIAAREQACA
ncbi:MAG: glycosyltransferase, partial [Actinomycetota bacterium]|nr:glycosyltransferase [Actinomycetota bacterium]